METTLFSSKCHPFMLALKHAGGQHGRICYCCAFSIFIYKFYSVHHLVGLNFLENEEELLLPKKASFDLCIEPSELQKSLQQQLFHLKIWLENNEACPPKLSSIYSEVTVYLWVHYVIFFLNSTFSWIFKKHKSIWCFSGSSYCFP